MKNNFIKIALGLILAVGSTQAADTRTFRNGYYFQNVNDITGNVTKNSGSLAGRITVITTDQRWTSDTVYILNNLTFVEAPATLTIEQGTIIKGEPATTGGSSTLDPADVGSLIITRGACISAQGTAESPIVFTSWGDPFTSGGIRAIPNTLNGVTKTDTEIATEVARYNTVSYGSSYNAHDIDAQWGGLIILGKAPVGFGAPTGSAGNIQVAITSNGSNYTQNPKFVFSNGGAYNLEPLFNPVPVASVRVDNGGQFTGSKPAFKATAADGSRTSIKTNLGTPVVAYNFGPDGTFDGISTLAPTPANAAAVNADTTTGDDDFWQITSVPLAVNSTDPVDNRLGGLQYNVPTKKETDPFLRINGFGAAEVALKYSHGTGGYLTIGAAADWVTTGSAIVAPTTGLPGLESNGTICKAYPALRLILEPTYLYGVIVKAPNAAVGGVTVLNTTTVPTLEISEGGAHASLTQASATCSVAASAVSDPSAIPLKGGIGANFIEGFQAIDGAAYGLETDGAVARAKYSGGIYGGTDSNDNSGCIRFCRFSFGGFVASPNNEINGITFGAAGSKTVTEYCEVFGNADDDYEMFAGYNNLKYCAANFGGDDCFDSDQGYRGKGQFLSILQNNTRSATADTGRNAANIGDNLTENDGNEDPNSISNATYPGTEFTYFNMTAIGVGYNCKGSSFPKDRSGPNFKDNAGGKIMNSVFVESPSGAIQDQATSSATDSTKARRTMVAPQAPMVAGEPQGVIAYNTWSKCGGGSANATANYTLDAKLFPVTSGRTSSGGGTINNSVAVNKMNASGLSNLFVATEVVASTGSNGRLNGVNPVLAAGVAERSNGTDPRASIAVAAGESTGVQASVTVDRGSDFFVKNNFRGAFRDFNWQKGWTLADQLGVFAPNNVVVPDVTLTRDASGNVIANFTGANLIQYSIEVSSDNKTYLPFSTETGNGGTISKNLARSGLTFVRVSPL
jgi:hypothetical protein